MSDDVPVYSSSAPATLREAGSALQSCIFLLSRAQCSGAQRSSGASVQGALHGLNHLSICFCVSSWMFRPEFAFSSTQVPHLCLLSSKCIPEDESMWDNKCTRIMLGEEQLVHHHKCCLVFVRCSDMPRVRTHCSGRMWINLCGLCTMSGQQVTLSSSPSKCRKQVRARASWCIPTKAILSLL